MAMRSEWHVANVSYLSIKISGGRRLMKLNRFHLVGQVFALTFNKDHRQLSHWVHMQICNVLVHLPLNRIRLPFLPYVYNN